MKKIVVLAKQVPDTANITGNTMKEDGTVNRGALPAIFNPEDLNSLEVALQIKEKIGAEISVITMGPPKAVEILKQSLYMGADKVYLVSDRKFAGADTLATSYVLSEVIKNIGGADIILAGRQAIDGDTAQVGPQVAEKLDINSITYISKLKNITDDSITVERDGEVQTEQIKTGFPVLLTITSDANEPRYPDCRLMLKHFRSSIEINFEEHKVEKMQENGWIIPTITREDLGLEIERCGLKGSPTKVHKIKSIKLAGNNLTMYGDNPTEIKKMAQSIIKDYVEVSG